MNNLLMRYGAPEATVVLPPAFRDGTDLTYVEHDDQIADFSRKLDLSQVAAILEYVQKHHDNTTPSGKTSSDAWLAPRLHATLRLSPREASDPAVWRYLAVKAFPAYVAWRWADPPAPAPIERYVSSDVRKQAFARMWWGAELIRDGKDYSLVEVFFKESNYPNSLHFKLLSNRPMALAVTQTRRDAGAAGVANLGDRSRDLLQALNSALVANSLDVIAPYGGVDPVAVEDWTANPPEDWSTMLTALPDGPDEAPMAAPDVARASGFISRVVSRDQWLRPLIEPAFLPDPDNPRVNARAGRRTRATAPEGGSEAANAVAAEAEEG